MNRSPAVEKIISEYDINDLYAIQEYGCNSEVAYKHAAYSDTTGFYDTYRDELENYIQEHFGREMLCQLSNSTSGDLDAYKSKATWTFIEGIAQCVIEERTVL
tara:strand:+ start:297 stop:605 length:309 start_codon:yes stop_codon:yes gene_type:complete